MHHVSVFNSSLLSTSIPLNGHVILYPSLKQGYLYCFYVLAVIKNAAVNICVQVFVQTYVFISRIATGTLHGKCMCNCLRNCQTVFE